MSKKSRKSRKARRAAARTAATHEPAPQPVSGSRPPRKRHTKPPSPPPPTNKPWTGSRTAARKRSKDADYDPGPCDPRLRRLWEITKADVLCWSDAELLERWGAAAPVDPTLPITQTGHTGPASPNWDKMCSCGDDHQIEQQLTPTCSSGVLPAAVKGWRVGDIVEQGQNGGLGVQGVSKGAPESTTPAGTQPERHHRSSILGPLARAIGMEWSDDEE